MKKSFRTGVFLTVLSAVTAVAPGTVMAGEWTEAEGKYRYMEEDGTYTAGAWKWIDRDGDGYTECYYFDSDGFLVTDTTVNGSEVNADGAWVVNGVVQQKRAEAGESSGTETVDDSWKDTYIAYIREAENEVAGHQYALVYIDDNEIPELYIEATASVEGDRVCTVGTDGSLVVFDLSRMGGFRYVERSGRFSNENTNMGVYFVRNYTLADGVFEDVETERGQSEYDYTVQDYVYTWNGETVTEEEFNSRWNAFMDLSQAISPQNGSDAETMIAVISGMES
ncbi:MAG: hypothetical protein LUF78_02300 [Clostridiales bacterium]|nr:hypothetical protein [Clostridiales bacterium]